ncbi:glutathione S-transferase family protein [Cognatilysobacter bugurensis]|uniref:Glutathione S-transferase n=1 Tax=Cognatilysobacter bugurensis TaxID=543356 RepID=A0A918T0K5_9GAMM|nr:glutathione S-transferase family protein [Lysobacter bugurensis]GHA78915.1 glutathione S-transferase [Lysobacter bugurensis]
MNRHVTFFYAPQTRASGTLALLEALQADYTIHTLDLKAGTQREPAYLAINPMGKVPAIRHGNAVVTEQVAVMLYLADLYADRGLAPALDDALRGPYLRWMAFYGSCFEPAVMDRSMKRDAGDPTSSGYGGYDNVMDTLAAQLATGPWLLGERFTAADVLWGTALKWTMQFGLVPDRPVFRDYVDRVAAVPVIQRAAELDTSYASPQAA